MTEPTSIEAENSQPTPTSDQVRASRIKLLTIISLSFGPILLAYVAFFYFPDWTPAGTTNKGELIAPPLEGASMSPELASPRTWILLQPVSGTCDEDCRQMMYLSRQVVTALGKYTDRVERYVITRNVLDESTLSHIDEAHKRLIVIKGDPSALEAISAPQPLLFLVDPNGNVIMYYTMETAGKPMLKDIKHLLKNSSIG